MDNADGGAAGQPRGSFQTGPSRLAPLRPPRAGRHTPSRGGEAGPQGLAPHPNSFPCSGESPSGPERPLQSARGLLPLGTRRVGGWGADPRGTEHTPCPWHPLLPTLCPWHPLLPTESCALWPRAPEAVFDGPGAARAPPSWPPMGSVSPAGPSFKATALTLML